MNPERQKIMDMLREGKLSIDEAESLMSALERGQETGVSHESQPHAALKSKSAKQKLRVKVDGTQKGEKIKVDVAIPLALARMADSIISNCMPHVAKEELNKQGIDISALNIGELVDTMADLDEDLVNVDVNNGDVDIKVRVYVE